MPNLTPIDAAVPTGKKVKVREVMSNKQRQKHTKNQ